VTPVLAAAIVRLGTYVSFLPVRRIASDSAAVDALGWLLLLTLPAIALGFLVGIVRWRLHVADAMEQLARSVIAGRNPASLRTAMRDALEDPALEVAYQVPGDPGGWVGPDGRRIEAERPGASRSVTAFTDNGGPAVAVVHDSALGEHRDFVIAAASVALVATENERLTARLRSSLRELEESRMRIVAAADKERRRIERDLHDGAQQRLVALRIKLELADELMTTDPDHAQTLLRETESELDEALEDVRSLARGIYPSLLADQGLRDALRAVALRAPLPTTVECKGIGRYPPEVESAVYFSCLEALQNAAKHAQGATTVRLSVAANGELRFEVRDDGAGFDTEHAGNGQGLTSMHDRLAAVGGRLTVRSAPGQGTAVSGTVPTAAGEAGIPVDSRARSLAPAVSTQDDPEEARGT
jgi:signal transduction histidine kinase